MQHVSKTLILFVISYVININYFFHIVPLAYSSSCRTSFAEEVGRMASLKSVFIASAKACISMCREKAERWMRTFFWLLASWR